MTATLISSSNSNSISNLISNSNSHSSLISKSNYFPYDRYTRIQANNDIFRSFFSHHFNFIKKFLRKFIPKILFSAHALTKHVLSEFFSKTVICVSIRTLLLRLNTESEKYATLQYATH